MAESPLDIFEDESIPPADPVVRRGIGAIGALAAVMAATVLIFGALVTGAIVGVARLASGTEVEVVTFSQLECRKTTRDVVVSATISRGSDFDSDFFVGFHGWDPESLYFDTDLAEDAGSLEPGDRVSFSGPADRADEINGVRMDIWRGEPGYAQTIPLTVRLVEDGCVASTDTAGP